MELDEFKDMLDKNIDRSASITTDTNTMIYHDTKGPLAAYEKNLKFTIFIFPFVAFLFAGSFISRHTPTTLLLLIIFLIEFLFALFNYGIVKKIRKNEGSIRENILGKISLLQHNNRVYLVMNQLLYLLLAIVLEIAMYYHLDSNFNGWRSVNPAIRIAFYAGFLAVVFFTKSGSQKKYYGLYLEKLQQLVEQMQ
jgi:hypothetical protein